MNHFQKYLVDEFAEDYQEGRMTRREALKLIASVTGSLVAASTILAACTPLPENAANPTLGVTVQPSSTVEPTRPAGTATTSPTSTPGATTTPAPTAASGATGTPASSPVAAQGTVAASDPAVKAGDLTFPGEGAALMGYLAQPSAEGKYPLVLVCHENRGLTDYIKDVTRRLAKSGYAALAVDLLSRKGGTAAIPADQVPGTLSNIPPEQYALDFQAGRRFFLDKPYAQADRIGMVGFCYGGGVTWLVAARMPELRAAVPFYGPLPLVTDVPAIKAAVLGIYGALDTRIVSGIPPVEEAMKANGKIFEKVIYPGADHAFHNDTGPRYNPEAATAAWKRTLEWFAMYLKQA